MHFKTHTQEQQEASTVTCTQTTTEIHMNHHHEGPEHQYSSSLSEKTPKLKTLLLLQDEGLVELQDPCTWSQGQETGFKGSSGFSLPALSFYT